MKKTIVALLLLVLMLMPDSASSRKEAKGAQAGVDKLQVLYLKTKFRNVRINLSRLREELERISTSMSAHESIQSHVIKRSCVAIGGTEAICEYMENITDGLSHVEKGKLSYYCYLQKYGVEKMKSQSDEYLHTIKEMHTQISNAIAMQLIDKAQMNIRSSSELINKVVETLQRCSGEVHH
ncbi:MAG: hypothetical protein JSV01_07135 [Desulfobacterales bacterium]|nr:MAG: hypothetical protein JSV01_07135 [Desulfobacterales bacterium]